MLGSSVALDPSLRMFNQLLLLLDKGPRLLAHGHPQGIRVTVFDPDRVTAANVGRQLFSYASTAKATVLQISWQDASIRKPPDEKWSAKPKRHSMQMEPAAISTWAKHQVGPSISLRNRNCGGPTVSCLEKFPDLGKGKENRSVPSCSLAESLKAQSLFINQAVVTFGANLLYQLLTEGASKTKAFLSICKMAGFDRFLSQKRRKNSRSEEFRGPCHFACYTQK